VSVVIVKVTPKTFTGERKLQRTGTKIRKKSEDEREHLGSGRVGNGEAEPFGCVVLPGVCGGTRVYCDERDPMYLVNWRRGTEKCVREGRPFVHKKDGARNEVDFLSVQYSQITGYPGLSVFHQRLKQRERG